jgi:N-acetylmuramoyl-L-alanine amidase
MEIKKANLTWRRPLTPLKLENVDGIALHHMDHPTADIYAVERWHKEFDNGTWAGFGYNYWIDKKGNIYEGRGLNQGAAVENNNSHIISIGFQGGYHPHPNFVCDKEMPTAQFEAGVWLIKKLMKDIPSIKTVHGHKYWNNTTCPGQYFPLEQMVSKAFSPDTHWADKYYNYLTNKGITIHEKRYSDNITRGEVFAMLARVLGYKE